MPSYRDLILSKRDLSDERDDWFSGIEGTVVETDPSTFSVKVLIPVIDEEVTYDEWVPLLTPYCGPPGYGHALMPEPGSEVVLFSRGNEGLSLFAISRFNEEYTPPDEALDGTHVLKTPRALKLLADLAALVKSGEAVDADAPDVRLKSGSAIGIHVQGAHVGFMGATPVARQQLPGPAVDEASDRELTNALRSALIALGLCQ